MGLSSCLLGQLLCVAVLSPMLSSCHSVSVESGLQKPVDCPLTVGARVGSREIQALLSLYPKLREYCFIETCDVPALQVLTESGLRNDWREPTMSLRPQQGEAGLMT